MTNQIQLLRLVTANFCCKSNCSTLWGTNNLLDESANLLSMKWKHTGESSIMPLILWQLQSQLGMPGFSVEDKVQQILATGCSSLSTFNFHLWRLRSSSKGSLTASGRALLDARVLIIRLGACRDWSLSNAIEHSSAWWNVHSYLMSPPDPSDTTGGT